MEHHSNHITWLETIADVEILKPGEDGNVDLNDLKDLLWLFNSSNVPAFCCAGILIRHL